MSYRNRTTSTASSSQASYLSASSTATTSSFSNFFSSISKAVTGKVAPQPALPKKPLTALDEAKEPIKSYLRFRPRPNDPTKAAAAPYIETLNETEVSLTAPGENTASTYKFTRVFDEKTDQGRFFHQTTLPLVKDVLTGSSGLLFAYGVSNSGKTYTIQGGDKPSDAGLLPRTLDVIFNSIEGMHSMCNFQPSRLTGVEASKPNSPLPSPTTSSNPATPRASLSSSSDSIPLSNLYEYAIWVSYAEIYNEKIYDLLEDSTLPSLNFSSNSLASVGLGRGMTVKRKALALKQDKLASHKYVHGLKEIRVFSADEARAVLRKGQNSRRVYSTLLNASSSRSHGCFTIKVIRNLKDCNPNDIGAASVSRLNIVDLAGSERSANTGSTGERLKEAGNINKSLMVLGQCMEVLRRNQVEKEKGRKPALVPYRHSKVTELFQSFFAGEGKAAMIVNVNPFDTGFEENTHVMRFSAVAKDITTTRSNVQTMTATPRKAPPTRVSVTSSDDTVLDITIEEDDDALSEEEEEDELVNYLFEENRNLRAELVDYKIKMAMLAEDVRSSLFDQFDNKMREMEREADRRVAQAIEASEAKMNKKIDILNQAHQYELELLADSGLSDLETIPDDDHPATSEQPVTPVRNVEVEVPRLAPTGKFPSVEATPNGKHAHVIEAPAAEPVSVSSDEEEVFVKPAKPKPKTSQPPRRSTRASSSRTTATIPKAKPKATTKAARPSPVITLTEEGDEDQSIIISAPKVKKKMKLRTKASAPEEELEALEDDVSFVHSQQKARK